LSADHAAKFDILTIEKKTGMRIAKEWVNNKVTRYGKIDASNCHCCKRRCLNTRNARITRQHCIFLQKPKKKLPIICVKTLASEKEITLKI
jgi:hypothetical protein